MLLPIIETERLLLRMYRADELEAVYHLITDKDVTRFFPDYYTVDKDYVLSSLPRRIERWQKHGFGQLGVFDKETKKLIGYCGLQHLDNTAEVEIYYGLHKKFWRKGLATEAAKAILRFGFEKIDLPRIVAATHPNNADSQKILLKLGMERGKNARFYELEAAYFFVQREDYRIDETTFYKLDFTEI